MTNEERDLITNFIQRVGGRPAAPGNFAGSVPAVGAQYLPPVDPNADALLAELFMRYPEARYRITQLAFVQEHALAEASNQINALKAQVQQLQAQQQQPQASPWGQPQPAPSRGLFGGLFGGGQQSAPQYQQPPQYQPAYAPPPQYAPGYQPGMFQGGGNGFLSSALRTATGVAGGMLAANAIESLFSGHRGSEAGFGGYAPMASTSYGESSWGAAPPPPSQVMSVYDQGGDAKDYPADTGSDWSDSSGGSDWSDSQ